MASQKVYFSKVYLPNVYFYKMVVPVTIIRYVLILITALHSFKWEGLEYMESAMVAVLPNSDKNTSSFPTK